jgi:hypothetical protein
MPKWTASFKGACFERPSSLGDIFPPTHGLSIIKDRTAPDGPQETCRHRLLTRSAASASLMVSGGLRTISVARRLAAILAADVAGYSRLMGADEAGTATDRDISGSNPSRSTRKS